MTRNALLFFCLAALFLTGCQEDENPTPELEVPETYSFTRDGASTVSFSGQSTRIAMAEELVDAFQDPANTTAELNAMFRNEGPNGEDVAPFASADLNAATKSIRSKVAASYDYFFADATTSAVIRDEFDGWIEAQVNEVFPRWNELASAGVAGQIPNGSSARYVSAQGLEYNQVFAKSLIGALMLDQTVNNYLSPQVLDEADNRATNDAGTLEDGKTYTTMEHKWDEAYGYVFGAADNPAEPLLTLGDDDSFLNEYLDRVNDDPDYAGIAQDVFDAFKRGRAAIVAGDYAERDAQAAIIKEKLSKVLAVRTIFYLVRGAESLEGGNAPTAAFHALSEAYGFLYALQFSRNPATGAPYLNREEVRELQEDLLSDGANGLWDVTPATIRDQASTIATAFGLSVDQAAD
ncbi:hypothetical protein GGR26_000684 [Lewinella marina]|uniref:DUF4856 domain-containing protein n=1 Tax=Neolewinella marina TaxID=438751 RepID=A0A2G0CIX6_9BACT|nr:DUF4856 domain-containing protein [Neolewinella marina]NJB84939.1 hypothetical protein [Neolewinella marina]PHK99908.1 DUF4856 domain-containing protein [Neolewinella marina]